MQNRVNNRPQGSRENTSTPNVPRIHCYPLRGRKETDTWCYMLCASLYLLKRLGEARIESQLRLLTPKPSLETLSVNKVKFVEHITFYKSPFSIGILFLLFSAHWMPSHSSFKQFPSLLEWPHHLSLYFFTFYLFI